MSRFARITAIFVGLAGAPGLAHHSFSAHYDLERQVTIEGVVTDYQFINPHVLVFMEVETDNGVEEWIAESNSPSLFRRRGTGLQRDSLKPGDRITLSGYPSRVNENDVHISLIVFPDGSEFRTGNAQGQAQGQFDQSQFDDREGP